MQKAVVIYSGGMDSFTLLNELHQQDKEIHAVSFNYGQRHSKELNYAAVVCQRLGITHKIVDVSAINQLMQGSSLTSDVDVPEGHYEEESMKATVVPNRNMIMISMAVAYAVSIEAQHVYIGAHAGDHAIYPDCRAEFITEINNVTAIANYFPVSVQAPYIAMSKGEIAEIGGLLSLDYSQAWTCYNGREKACGKCGACQERIEAMEFAGIVDPMEYEHA